MPYKIKSGWMAEVELKGFRKRHRCKTKREALAWELQTRKLILQRQQTNTVSLLEWCNAYLDFSKKKHVSKTYAEKRIAFSVFFSSGFAADAGVDTLDRRSLLLHFQEQASKRSGNAANKDRKNLLAAWTWGVKFLGLPPQNPFAFVPKQSEQRFPRRVPSLQEFWAVYNAATTEQDRRMLLLFLYTGARRSELFALRWQDVDFDQGRIRLFCRKNLQGTVKADWVFLTNEALAALKEQSKEAQGKEVSYLEEFVFRDPETGGPYLYRLQWLRRLCDRAGVPRFGLHGLRHLCATILAGRGVPLVDIQRHLRHEHLTTTQRYIHQLTKNRTGLDALSGVVNSPQNPHA